MTNANVKPNPDPNLNPYTTLNQKPSYIGFPGQFANLTLKFILISFKFAKFCRAVKVMIQIHSLITRFNFSVKGICIYFIQFKRCFTSIQIRDRTLRRRFPAFKFERGIRISNKFIQIRNNRLSSNLLC